MKISDPDLIIKEIEKIKVKAPNNSYDLLEIHKNLPFPRIKEIEYFRKVKKFFAYAERGSKKDVKMMLRELQ